ncbi:hypothetical protein [Rhizobium sp. 007]|uniref:hypothetical protein n=1 Tax=Rhizobium sp. 007 TaxID=2785056 RepID=UPI00188FC56C|nr:hypothetical protein [Rhizobium sp. 007]QPB24336.1 hypothetical protein ISN39_32795 [Rhizobium sp. 007]
MAKPARQTARHLSVPIPEVNFDRIDEVSVYEGLEQQSRSLVVDFDLLRNLLYLNWRCSPTKAMKRDHDSKLVNPDIPLLWCKHA